MNVPLTVIGTRLGLYKAMADGEPVTAAELAERTGTHERYVREWLAGQAAGGYVEYDPRPRRYRLPPSRRRCWPTRTAPSTRAACSSRRARRSWARIHVAERFVTGDGLGWHEHHHDLFHGTAEFFGRLPHPPRAGVDPGARGRRGQLQRGARVADVGCGHGISTILLAEAYPAVHVRRLRLPRGVDRAGPPQRRAGRRRGPRAVRGRHRDRVRAGATT